MVSGILNSIILAALLGLCALGMCDAETKTDLSSTESYARAQELVRAHEWDKGLDLLRGMLKRDPSNPLILNLTGLAFTGKGDLNDADQYFQRALKAHPDFLPALKNLGVNEFTLQQFDAAQKHFAIAAKRAPGDPVINLYLGEIAFNRHNFKRSAELFAHASAIVSRDPNLKAHLAVSLLESGQRDSAFVQLDELEPGDLTPASQFAVGLAFAQSEFWDRATPYFESLRTSYPGSYNVAFNLATCYLGTKKYSDTIALADNVIADGHETSELDDVLAEAYEGDKNTEQAINALRRAIALNPEDDDNYLDFSNICINHSDFENGLKVVAVGLKVHPRSYRLIFEQGILYAMEDQFNLAEDDFELSSRLAPESNFGYVGMGVTYLETGNAAKAIQLLHMRLRQQPNDPSLLYLLGEALLRNGAKEGDPEYAEAQAALEKSVRINPHMCLPHVDLGEIYLDEGRYSDAVTQLEQARTIDPKEKAAYSHLAVAYRRLGKTEDAKRTLNTLKDIYQREQGWTRAKAISDGGSSGAALVGHSN